MYETICVSDEVCELADKYERTKDSMYECSCRNQIVGSGSPSDVLGIECRWFKSPTPVDEYTSKW